MNISNASGKARQDWDVLKQLRRKFINLYAEANQCNENRNFIFIIADNYQDIKFLRSLDNL